tara:strand:- start:124 stop:708 length:585 start_codon:yes stop_codon:yes gene_type:complete
MKKKFNFYKREIIIVYCLVILGLVIITIKKHEEFDDEIENFAIMSNNMKNSKCKDNCLLKYNEDPDKLKVCKSYCKCKKKCYSEFGNKKCKEKCKEKKLALYRDDETKMRKLEIKDKIKQMNRKKRKEEKIKLLKMEEQQQEEAENKSYRVQNYINRIMNDYMGETDREHIVNVSTGTKKMVKDFKKIFTKYKI